MNIRIEGKKVVLRDITLQDIEQIYRGSSCEEGKNRSW